MYQCYAQIIPDGTGSDWQEEGSYVLPDPASLTGRWEMVASSDDVVPLGCERQPRQFIWVQSLAVSPHNPDVMYIGMELEETRAGFWASGVFKSVDGGRSWFEARAMLGAVAGTKDCAWCTYGTTVHDLYADPIVPQLVFAATDQRGLYRTTDGGALWQFVSFPDGLCLEPGPVRRGGNGSLYTVCGRLYASVDDGVTWQALETPGADRQPVALLPDPVRPDRLWVGMGAYPDAGLAEGLLFVSDDAGRNWRELGRELVGPTPNWVKDIGVCPAEPKQMAVALFAGGLFLSGDGGESWHRLDDPPLGDWGLTATYASDQTGCVLRISEGTAHETWRSDDGGQSWVLESRQALADLVHNPFQPEMAFALAVEWNSTYVEPFELWVRK